VSAGELDDPTARTTAFDAPRVASYRLVVTSGPDRGKAVDVDINEPSRALVGTGELCKLALTDRAVSRRHVALDIVEMGLRVVDLGSTNGTFVAGVRLHDVVLRGGETLTLGGTAIRVEAATVVEWAPDRPPAQPAAFGKLIGRSPAMLRLYPFCERLAASGFPVLIEGETGTGKEVLAESIHEASPRSSGPFVVFDCTAVPPNLVESALFGHERGAFTGATGVRRGVFEEAHRGTLLIDEIGELEIGLQPKLLRAIERQAVQRVGSNKWLQVDVRVLAATRRDLDQEIAAGRFRDDLFFRLAVGRVELPALRDRDGDVELLATHFWRALGGAGTSPPAAAVERLRAYRWPGNVRELHNAVARLLALGDSDPGGGLKASIVARNEAPSLDEPEARSTEDVVASAIASGLPFPRAREMVVHEFERRYVEHVLAREGGNVLRAAAAAGIARRYFQLVKKRHAI
jgi:DNA-binding NtrC family response regulator